MIGIVQGMYSIMAAIGETLCASVDILVEMRFSAKIQSVCTIWTCLSSVAGIILMPLIIVIQGEASMNGLIKLVALVVSRYGN